jgi:hypothetical protein
MGQKEETTTMPNTTRKWTATGSGMVKVRPGPIGSGEVESATFSYTYQYDEVTTSSYLQNNCNHNLTQTRRETQMGTATMGATVFIFAAPVGAGANITLGMPNGPMSGFLVTDAVDMVTGPTGCNSPTPTHTMDPVMGTLPTNALDIDAVGTTPDHLFGMADLHVDGTPPVDYIISYDLSR